LVFAFVAHTDFAVDEVVKRSAARPKIFPPAEPERMRRDVAEVLTHLERQLARRDHGEAPMLLSNDNMILAWWTVMGKGTLLLPDAFSVTLTQTALERKLAQAGRVLGLDDEAFVGFLTQSAFNSFFYSHNQYQTSIIWHPAPLWDYPDEVRDDLMTGVKSVWENVESTWRIVLPLSRRAHLRDFYRGYALDESLLPDYVVVSRLKTFPRDLALPENYRPTLMNGNYRVWVRRQ
jgi:hypothetical protein